MSLRKLTAGDGYSYLTRQVAAHDSTEKGHTGLADYYAEKGESPGRWMGAGLAGLGMTSGEPVHEAQMKALFGLGMHPNADALTQVLVERGGTAAEVKAAVGLGAPFRIYNASSSFNVAVAEAFTAYNLERKQRWNAPIPAEDRASVRTELGTRMFNEQHGRLPADARELSGFIARASRQPTSAIAGFDLTFSPVKSVSTLWALAPPKVAADIRAAHETAVAQTLAWLEQEVAHSRVGHNGVRQVDVRGLVAAAFTHRDSRAGDPDLHTHVAVSNKVQARDGRWLALDGRLLYAAKVAASEHYNTHLETELVARLGVEFAEREEPAGGPAARVPVREIRGVSTSLTRWWSRRRAVIESRQAELAAEFQQRHGRPPIPVEAKALADQATLETREAKHEPRAESDQRAAWRQEAEHVLGGAAEVQGMCRRVLGRSPTSGKSAKATRAWVEDAAAATIAAVEEHRATWNVWHLLAEAQRQARTGALTAGEVDGTVREVVAAAISRSVRLGVEDPVREPANLPPLRRANGESVYDVHGATLYTSAKVLAAEQQILTLARRRGGHALSEVRVETAISASSARGFELNDAQATMVRDLAASGAVVQLALAPAGTGKTTTMSVLADAWTEAGGQVIGLAPSAQAAHELSQALTRDPGASAYAAPTAHADTLAKLTWSITHDSAAEWPRWIRDIGPSTMVIIDEAGQASTPELAAAVQFVADRGGVVRLIGDDQQLAAVGAGGVLRDLQHTHGASTLSEVRRFADPAEAAVTLAVREGDPAALGFYADEQRIHVGDLSTAADQAYAAWSADRAAGLDTLLLAPTRELVSQLNARARADRLAHTAEPEAAAADPSVPLADGNRASAGDVIVTRRNSRRLMISRSDWVKNGDRWAVEHVHDNGGLRVRHLGLGRVVDLPADYVAEHVQLGYATTVHGAQGMTADTAHLVATGEETRQTFYVAVSRGRRANHIYLATGSDGDPHSLIDTKTLRPPTAIDVLTEVLQRDGSDRSASTTRREAAAYATQLHEAALRYQDALALAAEDVLAVGLGAERLAGVEHDIEAIWPGLTEEPAYPTLRARLCLRALDGADPVALLMDAAGQRPLDSSQDRAAVLDWRLDQPQAGRQDHPRRGAGPLPWLSAVPSRLAEHPTWGPYLTGRSQRVHTLAQAVCCEAQGWTPTTSPAWASGLSSHQHADLRADLAVWRGAFGITDEPRGGRRLTGPPQLGSIIASHQQELDRRTRAALGKHRADDATLAALPDEVRHDPEIGHLTERLGALHAAQVDVQALLRQELTPDKPLPDEHPADAVWWRIVRHLGPAALRASATQAHTLRPPWTTYLCERLGKAARKTAGESPSESVGERVLADAMWPALVAAVHARPPEWTAEQLIDAVTSGRGPDVRPEDLCSALVWRIATMTDAPFEEPEPFEPDLAPPPPVPTPMPSPADPVIEPATPPARILQLNDWALDHYTSMLDRSWASEYLRERLGADLSNESRFAVGYAPPGPQSLIHQLTDRGASIGELIDAGLARETERGRLVDVFRDRLVFPIHDTAGVVGFIGRRNPTKDGNEYAGPKYLNTRSTVVFAKSEQLYGLTESRVDLDAGGVPVLVEGPMDAIAVSLATNGAYVGIAPLGTAFTAAQANELAHLVHDDPQRIVIATDPDTAGRQSAQRAFWQLAALRADPRQLASLDGLDPADVLQRHGAAELAQRLVAAESFATGFIDQIMNEGLAAHDDASARVDISRDVARVIGAIPPDRWPELVEHVATTLDLSAPLLADDVLDAGRGWTDDPRSCLARELSLRAPSAPPASHPQGAKTPAVNHHANEVDIAHRRTSERHIGR